MALFGRKKEEASCGCSGNCDAASMEKAEETKLEGPSVKVLGGGCAKCKALEAAARDALERLGMDTTIEHVTDYSRIAAYGVLTTPALVVNGKVVSYGKALKPEEVVQLLRNAGEDCGG
ncbi:MAG: thioredoxin family protein [Bacillota bacterium]